MSRGGNDVWDMKEEMCKLVKEVIFLHREIKRQEVERKRFQQIILSKLNCQCRKYFNDTDIKVGNDGE